MKQTVVEYLVDQLIPKALSVEQYYHIRKAKEMENQKQQKYKEMLEMLKKAERTLREVYECDNKEIEQLIKLATEL
jgi:diadenosine tetraphosphate (Ap4A) HIT family hydrolase